MASPGFVGYAIDGAGDVAWIESDDATDFLVAITGDAVTWTENGVAESAPLS